jgi:hypothetical protein
MENINSHLYQHPGAPRLAVFETPAEFCATVSLDGSADHPALIQLLFTIL